MSVGRRAGERERRREGGRGRGWHKKRHTLTPPPPPDRPYTPDYAGFVDLSREIVRGRTSQEQRATVAAVLESLLPPGGPQRFRSWFPLTRFSAEANAFFTKVGFGWLVGPMDTVDVTVDLAALGLEASDGR